MGLHNNGEQIIKYGNGRITKEGGFAILVINDTGETSVKGKIVEADSSQNLSVELVGINDPDPCGIIYEAGIAIGDYMWVVVSGIADVLYGTAVDRGTFSRVPVTADSVASGLAIAEPLPTAPFFV